MHIKKNGKIIIEVIVIIYLLIFVVTAYSKLIVNAIDKSKYYYIRDDLLTLSIKENALLMEFTKYVNSENEIKDDFVSNLKELKLVYTYSLDSNIYIEVRDGKIHMINSIDSKKSYREIELKKIDIEEGLRLEFQPTLYLTDYV